MKQISFKILHSVMIPKSTSTYSTHCFFKDNTQTKLFNKYFFSVFSQSALSLPSFDDMPFVSSSLNTIQITYTDVYNALTALDLSKGTGIDGIGPAIYTEKLCICSNSAPSLFSYFDSVSDIVLYP